MSAVLDAALEYARAGLPVFPVRRDKRPRTEHGFKDATLDPDTIRSWWTRFPDDGIGMPTGSLSGIVAVDIDPRNGGSVAFAKLVEEFGQLPAGPSVITGGGGTHYYFQHPGGTAPVVHGFRPGLDFQGDGAYIIVPPSPHMSGLTYRWAGDSANTPMPFMPSWLFRIVYEHAPAPSGDRPLPEFPAPASDKEALERVFSGPNGDLHRWVYENRLAVSHVKDHAAYVAFCTALLFAGATEEQVPRILGFTPESWDQSGRAQWKHLAKHGGYYRRRDTLVRVSSLYRDALAALKLPPPNPAGAKPEEEPPAPRPKFPASLFKMGKNGWVGDDGAFRDWFRTDESFVVPVERGTFSSPGNFEILRYNDGYYNGTARAFVRGRIEDAFRHMSVASTEAFREEVLKGLGATSEFHRSRTDFNPPHMVCLANGVLDTGTRAITPHPLRPGPGHPVFTWKMPVAYDPEATCPRFEQFLREIMPDTPDGRGEKARELLVDLMGYALWRANPFQVFFVCVGDGANGKTTWGKVLQALVGRDAMSDLSLQQISSHRFAPAELDGKLVNLCDDLPYDKPLTATGALKILTGEGTMTVERKGQHPFAMRFDGKVIAMANRTPPTQDDTYAFWRRVVVFRFEQTFAVGDPRRDPDLERKLLAELPGILNLALKGLARVRGRLEFDPERLLVNAEEEWRRRSDPIRAELLDAFEVCPGAFVTNERIRDWHVSLCEAEDREPLSNDALGQAVTRAFPKSRPKRKSVHGKSVWGRPGIRERVASPGGEGGPGSGPSPPRHSATLDGEMGGGPPATGGLPSEKTVETTVASPGVAGGSVPAGKDKSRVSIAELTPPATPGDEGGSGALPDGPVQGLPGASSESSEKRPEEGEVSRAYNALLDAIQRNGDIPFEPDRMRGWLEREGHAAGALNAAFGRIFGRGLVVKMDDGRYQLKIAQTTTGSVADSQRERLEAVLRIGAELQRTGGGTFSMDELLAEADRAGVERARAEALVHALRNQGELIEPRPGRWTLARFY